MVRPVRHPAFLSLAFAPGEAAQVDWGSAGSIAIGGTRRRLSFFVMVLCHSRMAYVEFTCGECLEHFLACHQNAFEFFGGTPATVLIDNLKTGVLLHPFGEKATFHPRYLDFAPPITALRLAPAMCVRPMKRSRFLTALHRSFEILTVFQH